MCVFMMSEDYRCIFNNKILPLICKKRYEGKQVGEWNWKGMKLNRSILESKETIFWSKAIFFFSIVRSVFSSSLARVARLAFYWFSKINLSTGCVEQKQELFLKKIMLNQFLRWLSWSGSRWRRGGGAASKNTADFLLKRLERWRRSSKE